MLSLNNIVQTWNENTKQFEWKRVLNIFERVAESTLHIRLSNGQVMKVTPEHKILVNAVWNEAKSIEVGDKLLSFTGEDVRVIGIKKVNKEVTVYNFETEDNHTYIAYGVVVHNRCALNGPVKVGNKTYQITNGEDVYDSSGRKLTAIEVYDIINRPVFDFANPSQDDISSLASTLSRDEVFQILVHYQNDALQLDPSGMQRQSLVRIIAADVQYTHAPLTIQQQNIIRQVGQSADITYLTTGLITVAAPPVQGNSNIYGSNSVKWIAEPKISQQMSKRGWNVESIQSVLDSPTRVAATRDIRNDPITRTRVDQGPATVYYQQNGHYVIRNDLTGKIVQVSDQRRLDWKDPFGNLIK